MTNKERSKNISHFAELDELAKGSYYVIPQKSFLYCAGVFAGSM